MALTPRERMAAAITRVVGIDPYSSDANKRGLAPYFGAILRGLVRRETPGLGTLGVSKVGVLYWDPDFVDKVTTEELATILLHEVMHVALKHHERFEALGVVAAATSDKGAKAYIANIAGDLSINCDLQKMVKMPTSKGAAGVFPKDFGLPDGLVMEDYYRRLLKQAQKQPKSGGGDGQDGGEGTDGQGQGKPGAGQGWCGSCAGHPLPQEPEAKGGKDKDGRSEAEMERFRKQSAEAVREAVQKGRGTVPDSLQVWADQMLSPPKIPWREKLARIVRGAVAYKAGCVDLTWKKPSRRQAGVGYGVGRPIVPAMHAPIPVCSIGIDTSGSMSAENLTAALAEVQGVLAAIGAAVTLCVCDAEVHGIKPIKTAQEAAKMLTGGGGTVLEPAIKAMAELKPKPGIAIMCTDGYCDDPPSYGLDLIWVVVGGNQSFKPTNGEVIVVEDD